MQHLLFIDLATGITTPHKIADHIEGKAAANRLGKVNDQMTVTSSDRAADEPLPKKMT